MALQKTIIFEESGSLVNSDNTYELESIKNSTQVSDFEIWKLKGALKFLLSVMYFIALVYLSVKLFN